MHAPAQASKFIAVRVTAKALTLTGSVESLMKLGGTVLNESKLRYCREACGDCISSRQARASQIDLLIGVRMLGTCGILIGMPYVAFP